MTQSNYRIERARLIVTVSFPKNRIPTFCGQTFLFSRTLVTSKMNAHQLRSKSAVDFVAVARARQTLQKAQRTKTKRANCFARRAFVLTKKKVGLLNARSISLKFVPSRGAISHSAARICLHSSHFHPPLDDVQFAINFFSVF